MTRRVAVLVLGLIIMSATLGCGRPSREPTRLNTASTVSASAPPPAASPLRSPGTTYQRPRHSPQTISPSAGVMTQEQADQLRLQRFQAERQQYKAQQQSYTYHSAPAGDATVYITNAGKKYHRAGCQYLRHGSRPITLQEARARGYTACSKCF